MTVIKQRYPEALKNYEFIGWSTDGTEANIVDFGWDFEKQVYTYIVKEDVDFIAVWKRAYNITIDSNGPTWFYDENGRRTTVSTSARCILGNHFSPSWRVPTENLNSQYQGHTLLGWSKTRDGKVVIPVNGGSEVPTGDTTYYAVWHNIVNDPAVAATETSTGKTAGSHCSVCGKVFVAQKVIPKRSAKPTDKITITKTPSGVKAKAAKKGKATLTWKKFKQAKKTKAIWKKIKSVEVQYSTDKNFKTGVISKTLPKKKTKLTVKKLKAKTTYYFRVRYVEGPYKVSKWSSVKKVKAKK